MITVNTSTVFDVPKTYKVTATSLNMRAAPDINSAIHTSAIPSGKLKKNDRGLTYFTRDDARTLSDVSARLKTSTAVTIPNKNAVLKGTNSISNASIVQLVDTLRGIEKSIADRITSVLDEKLDGMDDVVMELIRVKTENETMRFKINELNKENYKLKKEVNSFKKVPFGFYAKATTEKSLF